ncbi:antitoxin VbhA family protein [Bradyrhizobium brasilense]|uniref:antitoxin VbhA family protein n=1 Tax=Bradyrhizobium brasilense TaxID=1419277 RepID=UPI001E613CBD|nr:antitoxin VbhA family protein [Bradyrhizobium brasilense]MCC8976870.1 antitoxin VbhA family protein [Bradyrhizobium brasilense]
MASKKQASPPPKEEEIAARRKAAKKAAWSLRMEGFTPPAETADLREARLNGQLSHEEFVAELLKRHKKHG